MQRKIHRARRILDAVGHAYPGAWSAFDTFRRNRGQPGFDWPDWCYMPIAAGYAVVSGGGDARVALMEADRPAIVTALATWRMTQGIYRFDVALLDAVLETPIEGDIPAAHLEHLPEWCVYVELASAGIDPRLHGAWLHMEYDVARGGQREFRVVFDTAQDPRQPFGVYGLEPLALPLAGSIDASLDHLARSAQATAAGYGVAWRPEDGDQIRGLRELARPMLAIALYLCADPDIARVGQGRAADHAGSRRSPMRPANGPTEWEVGTRIGAALRAAYQREQTGGDAAPSGRHMRPHIRRAHWHTILSGPRRHNDGSEIPSHERRSDLRWMPPLPINVDAIEDLPSTIRPV